MEDGQTKRPERVLSLFDAVCIIVGTIIGSGIFATAPGVAQNANGFGWMVGLWVAGGLISLVGAMCFAELMTTHQQSVGGDYVYLKKAYGKPVAFMFAWAAFWIVRPGNIGAMAMTFARYFNEIVSIGPYSEVIFAVIAVLALSVTNLIGLRSGKGVQNVLTSAKVLGILAIVALAFIKPAESLDLPTPSTEGSLWLAMIFVMFTYGGWNDIAFVTGEIREPKKNLFRSLLFGTLTVATVYVLVNIAFVFGLGYNSMASSQSVATDLASHALGSDSTLGQRSSQLIAALVCISCLGAINGMIITSPRIYYALGQDVKPLRFLAQWNQRSAVPWQAIMLQATVTIILIFICLQYKDGFEVILVTTAPYFWGFLGLTIMSMVVLRMKTSKSELTNEKEGVYRVPLFPLPAIFFFVVCGALVYSSIGHVNFKEYWLAFGVVTALMGIGIVLGFILTQKRFTSSE